MGTILLIEDNSIIAMDITQILENNRHRVDIARNGVEALKNIKQKTYDVIITSNMPQMTEEELYREILVLNRDLAKKIIFISTGITKFAKSTGNPILVKPFNPEQLIETVTNKNF
jgi:CheY-like chemotaxis protein